MTTTSPATTAHLLQQWERFFMTDEESLTGHDVATWECDIDHLIREANASDDTYLHALAERCERLAGAWGIAEYLIDEIRKNAQCR